MDRPEPTTLNPVSFGRSERKRTVRKRDGLARGLTMLVLSLCWATLVPREAPAEPPRVVRVTSGDHPLHGRVVLNAPGLTFAISRDGGHVLITFSEEVVIGDLPRAPRNVLAIRSVPAGLELTLPPGTEIHASRMGDKIVIDIDDLASNRASAATAPGRAGKQRIAAEPPKPGGPATAPATGTPGEPTSRAPGVAAPAASPTPTAPAASPVASPIAARSEISPPAPARASPALAPVTPLPSAPAAPSPIAVRNEPAPPAPAPTAAPSVAIPAEANTVVPAQPLSAPSLPPPAVALAARTETDLGPPRPTAAAPPNPPATAPIAVPPRTEAEPLSDPAPKPEPTTPPTPAANEPATPKTPAEAQQETPPPPDTVQVWPVTRDAAPSGPVALVATKARPPGGLAGAALHIPFAAPVGAALFSRGAESFVVFDERRPIDLAAVRDDPVFGSAVVTIHPGATVIRLVRPPGRSAMLSPTPAGWRLSIVTASPRPNALAPVITGDGMTIGAEAPGQVVTITDPQTGATLMIGTQRQSGQGVLIERRNPDFSLPVTGQGIVIDPVSDAISLRVTQAGFVLSGARGSLALSQPQTMDEAALAAAGLTRLFEFPRQSTETLTWRARQQAIAAATAPPLTRGPRRHALAESLIGLGLGVEAQTLLRVTVKDDPAEASSPTTTGLAAIAALLAGRPTEAEDLADPRLTGSDEIALWRAIRSAMADEGSAAAAATLASTAPMLFTYPDGIRDRILPLALETMILGGEAEAAARLLTLREQDPRLAFARALLAEARGDNPLALKLFDAVANSRSAYDHARGAVRATELRLAMKQLDNKSAADALEARLYAWRGDRRELALRFRIAELRRKAGDWRAVFAMLRGAKADFPGQAVEIESRMKEAFAVVPRDLALAAMPPTELIALLEENVELMADGPDGEPLRVLLAEKLMALDLPKRADPVLARLMRAAPPGPARAGFGATLATLRQREGDIGGAILALSESSSAGMPDAVRERRALITARVDAERGDTGGALEALAAARTQEAEDERATILEQARDWPGARDALRIIADRMIPRPVGDQPGATLDNSQRRVALRFATAAARAEDNATLTSLREKLVTRIGTGPEADLFRLLTAAPVRGTADLGRARAEMGLARAITADLNPKTAAAKAP